jgi:amino acid transporter
MQKLPSYLNLYTRFILTSIGIVFMIALPIMFGYKESYSRYYTDCPLLFTSVFNVLAMGLLIHRNKEWTYPSIFLITLALFNMHDFAVIHYTSAIAFFLSSTYAMLNDKRVPWFGRTSLCLYVLWFFDLMWFEMVQVILVCVFHLVYTFKMFDLKTQKKILTKERQLNKEEF